MQNNDSWDKKNIAKVNVESYSFTEALKKAAEFLDLFITFFQNKDAGEFKFFIKGRFEEGESVEHLWIIPITYNNDVFTGTINNEPNKLKNVSFGSKVKLTKADVEDWIVAKGNEIVLGDFIANITR